MNLSKRVVLAVLCLVVVAPCAATAGSGSFHMGITTLQPTSAQPAASGVATQKITDVVSVPPWGTVPWGNWSISCTGLTPGATYRFAWGTATADRKGTLAAHGKGMIGAELVQVFRIDPTRDVLVLSGSTVWQFHP